MKRTITTKFCALGVGVAVWLAAPAVHAQQQQEPSQQPRPSQQQPSQQQPSQQPAQQQPAQQQPAQQQPAQPQPSEQAVTVGKKLTATATVDKVDLKGRHLTLKTERGKTFTIEVPDSVKRLDEIKPGDRITVDYYESVGVSLKKAEGSAQPGAGETTVTERRAGKLPSGAVAHTVTATVEVMAIDRANNKVMVKRPNGDIDTIDVTDPAMQADLANLKEGDRIQATYTEAAAISVQRSSKAG